MNKFLNRISLSIILLSLSAVSSTQCMLNNIIDTDSILHDNYKYLSLVHGAIAWETGVIRRMYDVGQIFPVYKQDKRGRKIIENYENPGQTHKTIRLIHAFFYRVPGSTGEADFGVTDQLSYQDPFMVAQIIAKVIGLCQNVQADDQAFKNAVQALATHKNLQELAPKLIKNPLFITGQNRPAWKVFIEQVALYKKKNQPDYPQLVAHVETITQFCENLGAIQRHLNTLLKFQALLGAQMGQVMLDALRESNPQNPDALYPPHTVEMILLAFVYKKYSYDRNVLKAFYDELNTQLGSKLLLHELDNVWVKESFAPVKQAEALKTIENIFAPKDLMQSINQHFAEFVYNAFQIRSFPAPVGYENAVYEYEQGKKTLDVADCMENTMRNFINLYAYDAEENKFMLKQLLATMGLLAVHPVLANFLTSFGEVNTASSQEAHNAWLRVISNIPYVAYNRMVNATTGQSTVALETGKGYVAIPEKALTNELLGWLKNTGYQVLDKNQYGYELQPSVKNIIIVLDHLLQLNIFSNAGGLAKEFMRPDFIKEYFPRLCAAMKATGFLSTQKNARWGESKKNFDALDYTASKIYTTITLTEITCEFTTNYGHGELELIKTGISSTLVESLLQKIHNFIGQPSLSLLITDLLCKQNISFDHLKNNPEYLYINLFAAPLENTDFLHTIIDKAFLMIMNAMPLKIKIDVKNLLLRLADKQPDVVQQSKNKMNIVAYFIEKLSNDDVITDSINVMNLFTEATKDAVQGIANNDPTIGNAALDLFKALFGKNQAFDKAIETAAKGMVSQNADVRLSSLNLFKALVENNKAFAQATQVAVKGIIDQNKDVKRLALDLFKALFAKNQSFDRAIEVAAKGIFDESWDVKRSALDIFVALFEKDQAFAQAMQVAEKGIVDQNADVRHWALALFAALVEKNQASEKATQAAEKGIADQNAAVRRSALLLFAALVKHDQVFAKAIQAAESAMADQSVNVIMSVLALFTALVEKNQAFAQATQAAVQGFASQNINIIVPALRLLKALVEKNQSLAEAIEAATKGIASQDRYSRLVALDLFKWLIIKAPDETKKAIQKLLDDPNRKLTEDDRSDLNNLLEQ